MTIRKVLLAGLAAAALTLAPAERAHAAEAVSCLDNYLSCLNVASQESGLFWRTLREGECGAEYYGCIRKKVVGV